MKRSPRPSALPGKLLRVYSLISKRNSSYRLRVLQLPSRIRPVSRAFLPVIKFFPSGLFGPARPALLSPSQFQIGTYVRYFHFFIVTGYVLCCLSLTLPLDGS